MSEKDMLLPCPFCGGEAEQLDLEDEDNFGGSCISCKRCGASSPVHFDRKENLYSSWNDRARAALSNEEAGEAALAGAWEKGREAAAAAADAVGSGMAAHIIRRLPNPYTIPTVNGTDEPPNAIPAGVIPSDAGRTDYEAKARSVTRAIQDRYFSPGEGDPSLEEIADPIIAAALKGAGGRVELVERSIGFEDCRAAMLAVFREKREVAKVEAVPNPYLRAKAED